MHSWLWKCLIIIAMVLAPSWGFLPILAAHGNASGSTSTASLLQYGLLAIGRKLGAHRIAYGDGSRSFRDTRAAGALISPEAVLHQLNNPNVRLDWSTYAYLLRYCGTVETLSDGKRVHHHIFKSGLEANTYLANLLVQMYGRCGALDDAHSLFARLHQRDIFAWNFIIAACVSLGHRKEALNLFDQMRLDRVKADKFTFVSLLSASASLADLGEGKAMHAELNNSGVEVDVVVGTALINLYGKCGCLEDAQSVFDKMPHQNVCSWNVMISAYAHHGKTDDALRLFNQMEQSGAVADKVCYLSLLSAFASQAILAEGMQLHVQIIIFGFDAEIAVGNALVNMYGKCGGIGNASAVFDKMPVRNVITWTTLIAVYAQHGQKDFLELFKQMQTNNVIPNNASFINVLHACANERTLGEGKQVHAFISSCRFEVDVTVGSALVNMYAKCGSLEDAQIVFNKMSVRNTDSWSAIIGAYTKHGKGKDVLHLCDQMRQEGVIPHWGTLVSMLTACVNHLAFHKGKQVHSTIVGSGLDLEGTVVSALINMYGHCGSIEDAHWVFIRQQELDVVSWNAMIGVYVHHERGTDALRLFSQMRHEGVVPDKVTFINLLSTYSCPAVLAEGKRMHINVLDAGFESDVVLENALVNMYCKCASVEDTLRAFNKVLERDIVTWTALIAAYVNHGRTEEALQFLDQMWLEGLIPDKVLFISILDACTKQGALTKGRRVHTNIVASGFESDVIIGTALLNMYGKCGNLEAASTMFKQIHKHDVISWTAMIAVCAQHGQSNKALQLFDRMLQAGMTPNSTTFLNILTACSHTGLVSKGCHYFVAMIRDYCIKPVMEHYNCMVDLFGRAGLLEEAETLIKKALCWPSVASWMALLGACRCHLDTERAARASWHVSALDPEDDATRILLSKVYSEASDATSVAAMLKIKEGQQLSPVKSWHHWSGLDIICTDGEIQSF